MKRLLTERRRKDALPKINRRYETLKFIGRGSFGVVYLVRRQADSRQCVLKQVDMSAMSDKDRREAVNECEVLQKLRRHPHIIRFIEHFHDDDGKLCIVMDYADGGDLSQRIELQKRSGGSGFSEEQVLDWFVQICLALKHAHDRKVRGEWSGRGIADGAPLRARAASAPTPMPVKSRSPFPPTATRALPRASAPAASHLRPLRLARGCARFAGCRRMAICLTIFSFSFLCLVSAALR